MAASASGSSAEAMIRSIGHTVIVMSALCDLGQDFEARYSPERPTDPDDIVKADYEIPKLLPNVIVCPLYDEDSIRQMSPSGTDAWRRVKQNQNERYHHLQPLDDAEQPAYFMDFKNVLSLPTEGLYAGLAWGGIRRAGVVPDVYIHDIMHRFYAFQSRIGLPD